MNLNDDYVKSLKMALLPADVMIGNVFLSLEAFLQKAAALDIFDGLLFDYKMKPAGNNNPTVVNDFLNVIGEFNQQLQEISEKYLTDIENKVAVEIIQVNVCNEQPTVENDDNKTFVIPTRNKQVKDDQNQNIDLIQNEEASTDTCSSDQREEDGESLELEDQMKTRKKGLLKRSCNQNISLEPGPSQSHFETRGYRSGKAVKNIKKSCCEWQCTLCSRVFSSRARHTAHLTKVHKQEVGAEDIVECSAAGPASPTMAASGDEEEDIELDRASLSVFCCTDCYITYKSLPEFTEHTCQIRDDMEERDEPPKQGVERLLRSWEQLRSLRSMVCGHCLEEYRSLRRMVHHLPRCHPGPYTCELCPSAYPNKRELNYHKRKQHSNEKSFFCEMCGLAFKLRTSLQKHLVSRHENSQGPFLCSDCGEAFSKRIHLTNHRAKVHELEKNFLCQVCGNKFCTQSSLTAHLETHTGQRRFSCAYCPMSFTRKEKFIFHTRIHTGERPYQCLTCFKSFIRKSKLDEHARRHRGEKPFPCTQCSKKYAAAWDLRQHIRKNHNQESVEVSEEESSSRSEATEISTVMVPGMPKLEVLEVMPPPPENLMSSAGPRIVSVESLQLPTLETVPTAQYIQLPIHQANATHLQIQVPISLAQSFDLSSHQGQQILLTSLANFDVTTVGNLQF